MAPIDPTTTWRYKVSYTGPAGTHTALFHGQLDGGSVENLRGDVADYVAQAVELQYTGTTWNIAQFALPGESFFNDDPEWEVQTSTTAAGFTSSSSPSAFLNFVGREISGPVKVKLYLFEVFIDSDNQMRIQEGEVAGIDAVLTELNSSENEISSIAGNLVNWRHYANIGQNDYLTHRARRS